MRDCDNCARCGRDGCKSWDCDFVPRKEAIEAWKEKHETADCKTENNSEKPNNCEVKNYCDDCLYTDTCDSKEFFYACTSKATISKMEQVDKDINVRSKDEVQTDDLQDWKDRMWAEAIVTEPQTCSVNGRPYDCGNCEYHKCTADEPQADFWHSATKEDWLKAHGIENE